MKKITKSPSLLFYVLAVALLFAACGPKEETTITISFEAVGSGPFFSGPNSLMADYEVKMADIKGLEGVTQDQIKEIKIKSIAVELDETSEFNFGAFSSASLQMVSADTDMQTVAIKNPIDSQNQKLQLGASDEADIADYFKNDKFSLVLDLDFIEDSFEEEIGAIIVMELNVKHN